MTIESDFEENREAEVYLQKKALKRKVFQAENLVLALAIGCVLMLGLSSIALREGKSTLEKALASSCSTEVSTEFR